MNPLLKGTICQSVCRDLIGEDRKNGRIVPLIPFGTLLVREKV